jgi:hypothetical protein
MTLLGHTAFAGPLDDYRYKNRLIVLSLPQDAHVEVVRAMLAAHREGIEERHLRIIDVSPSERKIPTAVRLNPKQTEAVRHQLQLDAQRKIPTFVLIGKDGGEAARSHGTWNLEKWFALVDHIQQFLLELGAGFAFVGRQVHLEVGDEDFYLDLLFYHLKLRRYVVIELKARAFDPGDAGQINLYRSAVDDLLRHPDDQPTIGLLLCKGKNKVLVEYALSGLEQSIAVADWKTQLTETLPPEFQGSLPTIEEIEAELSRDLQKEEER